MATLIGNVGDAHRPLLRLSIVGAEDEVLALLDTGFNGELLVAAADCRRVGVQLLPKMKSNARLADGRVVEVQRGECTLAWLGKVRQVQVLISSDKHSHSADDPLAIIGTRLLAPHLLLIDFGAGTVEIEAQE